MINNTSSVQHQPEVLSHAELMEKGKEFIGIMYLGSNRAGKLEYTSHPIMTGIDAPDGLYHYKVDHDTEYKVSYDFVSDHNAKLLQRVQNTSKLLIHAFIASFIVNLLGLMLIKLTNHENLIGELFFLSMFFGFLYYFIAPAINIQVYNNIPLFSRLAQYPVNEKWLTINEKLFEDHTNIISMSKIREICTKNGIGLLRINPYNALISNHIAPVKEVQNTDIVTKKLETSMFAQLPLTKIAITFLFLFNMLVFFIVEMDGSKNNFHFDNGNENTVLNSSLRRFEEIIPIQDARASIEAIPAVQISTNPATNDFSNTSEMPGLSIEELGKGYLNPSEEPEKLLTEMLFKDDSVRLMIIFSTECPNSNIAISYAGTLLNSYSISSLVLINDRFNKNSCKNSIVYSDLYDVNELEAAIEKKELLKEKLVGSNFGFEVELVKVKNPSIE